MHDVHLGLYAAMFQGHYETSWTNSQTIMTITSDQAVRMWPDYMESYVPIPMHVLIRFGKFAEILELPFPEDREMYCSTVATLFYARGIAKAALGDVAGAREEQQKFREARKAVPGSRMQFQVTVDQMLAVGRKYGLKLKFLLMTLVSQIAEEMLEGEILFREGKEECFAHLRKAVELDDGLNYMVSLCGPCL